MRGELEGQLITLINVCNPPGENVNFVKKMSLLLDMEVKRIMIIAGDFILVMDEELDILRSQIPIVEKNWLDLYHKCQMFYFSVTFFSELYSYNLPATYAVSSYSLH